MVTAGQSGGAGGSQLGGEHCGSGVDDSDTSTSMGGSDWRIMMKSSEDPCWAGQVKWT